MSPGSNGWFRRRTPRLSGTLHIRDATGQEHVVPLRGRAALLTAGGSGLRGYGEVWAVHTTATAAEASLMIAYRRDASAVELSSGLCAAGQTIVLDEVSFTWRAPSAPPNGVPHQRPAAGLPQNRRTPPARATNTGTRTADGGSRSRPRNMAPDVIPATPPLTPGPDRSPETGGD